LNVEPVKNILWRPTLRCNGSCRYCNQQGNKSSPDATILDTQIFTARLEDYLNGNKNRCVLLTFHGGEITLTNKEIFDCFATFLDKNHMDDSKESRIILNAQSNLLSLPDWFEEFVKKYNVRVATSLDGPERIHSLTRNVSHTQFRILLQNIEKIRDWCGSVGAVCVVGKHQLGHEKEIVDFFSKNKINPRFNIQCDNSGPSISYESYFSFLKATTAYWFNTHRAIIRPQPVCHYIEQFGKRRVAPLCSQVKSCAEIYLAVNGNLNCWTCGRFANIENFFLGSLKEFSLEEIWGLKMPQIFNEIPQNIRCKDIKCKFWSICGGGCLLQAFVDSEENRRLFCYHQYDFLNWLENFLFEVVL